MSGLRVYQDPNLRNQDAIVPMRAAKKQLNKIAGRGLRINVPGRSSN
jgi:hypothetical protein